MKKRTLLLTAAGLALAVSLAACSNTPAAQSPAPPADSPTVESPSAQPEAETAVFQGTLNTVDAGLDYLVAVDDSGNYCRFNLGGVDTSGLEPGDGVTITYTGELSTDDEPTATITAIEKAA